MGFLHRDTAPDADLTQSGVRGRAIVEQSLEQGGGMTHGGGFMTEHSREEMLAGDRAWAHRKVVLRIELPGKDPYTVTTKVDYPLMKGTWLFRGSSFEVLVDPDKPEHFAVDWSGPHQSGTAADLAGQDPMLAAAMKGAGIDIEAVTRQQLAARQLGSTGPSVVVNGQLIGAGPSPGDATVAPSPVDQLTRLAELHNSGALTDEEFAAAKARVLGN